MIKITPILHLHLFTNIYILTFETFTLRAAFLPRAMTLTVFLEAVAFHAFTFYFNDSLAQKELLFISAIFTLTMDAACLT